MEIENAEQFDRIFPAIANGLTHANLYPCHFGQKEDSRFVLESVRENLKLHEARLDIEFARYRIPRNN